MVRVHDQPAVIVLVRDAVVIVIVITLVPLWRTALTYTHTLPQRSQGVRQQLRNHSVLVCVQLRGVDGVWTVVLVVLVTVAVSNDKKKAPKSC